MRLGGGPSGLGDLDTLEREIHIEGLPAGSYLVEMRDTFGNDAVFPAVNQQPAPLLLRLEPSDFNGFNIPCWGGADGTLTADNCLTTDSVLVMLLKYRPFFAPNAFSPNGDGANDTFTIFAGPALKRLKSLRVYSRWGELIFERLDFPANTPSFGWDGRFKGQILQEGLFVLSAELEFVDGISEIAEGEVLIVQ